jgi:hypothetical protein
MRSQTCPQSKVNLKTVEREKCKTTNRFWRALNFPDETICNTPRFRAYLEWYPTLGALANITLNKVASTANIVAPNGVKVNTMAIFENYVFKFGISSRESLAAKEALWRTAVATFNVRDSDVDNFINVLSLYYLHPNPAKDINRQQCFEGITAIYSPDDCEFNFLTKCSLFAFPVESLREHPSHGLFL